MNIDDLKTKLDDETYETISKYVTTLEQQRDAARQESISGRKSLKAERDSLANVRDRLLEKLGLSSVDEIDSLPDIKGQAEAAKQYEAKLKKLERDYQMTASEKNELLNKIKMTETDSAIERALSSFEWHDKQTVKDLAKLHITTEGDQIFFNADGRILTVEDGVKLLASNKPFLVKNKTSGSGQGVNSVSGGMKNPWLTGNITQQVMLSKENPQLAAQLKLAAGVNANG